MKELIAIQSELKAPKGQRNNFGNYNYRSCEDILEALKPLLNKHNCVLTLSDEMIEVGGRVYVKASVKLKSCGEISDNVVVTAFAREPDMKKGMDSSQITGAASSYARKYALNGLFCIDDTKDADTMKPETTEDLIKACTTQDQLGYLWTGLNKKDQGKYKDAFSKRKAEL